MIPSSAQRQIWKALAVIWIWLAASTCSHAVIAGEQSPVAAPDAGQFIQVSVYRLSVDPTSQQPVVTLIDLDEKGAFPIWIGLSEARAIHSELQGTEHQRPLTHDLLARIIGKLDGKIHRIIITHIKDNVFYATLVIEKNGSLIEIDARPSDSIAMALKFNAPIYVNRSLFEKMSIPLAAREEVGDQYGLDIQNITPELAKYMSLEVRQGVMVSAVRSGSRAENDGIQLGDILVEIDGQQISDVTSAKDLIKKSRGFSKVKLIRQKQILTIDLHLK